MYIFCNHFYLIFFLQHIVHESIYFMSFLMSVLKMIMFLNCNSLPQKRLYFKRKYHTLLKRICQPFDPGLFLTLCVVKELTSLQLAGYQDRRPDLVQHFYPQLTSAYGAGENHLDLLRKDLQKTRISFRSFRHLIRSVGK